MQKKKDYVLKLHQNIYGQKQAGKLWNQYLTNFLINKFGFKQSSVDDCVFYKGNMMYVLFTYEYILDVPHKDEGDQVIQDIRYAKLNITIKGDLQNFLEINIDIRQDG